MINKYIKCLTMIKYDLL